MSALRISRPGIAGTTLIPLDDGATPHRSGHRFYLLPEATPSKALAPQQPPREGRVVVRKPYTGPRCGHVLPLLGEPCYRRPHTGRDHRSEAAVKADMQRRQARSNGTEGRRDERAEGMV